MSQYVLPHSKPYRRKTLDEIGDDVRASGMDSESVWRDAVALLDDTEAWTWKVTTTARRPSA